MKKLLAPIVGIIALLVFTATLPAEITLQLEPPVQDAEEFATLDIIVGNSGELGPLTGIALTIRYDPAMIVAVDATYGNYLDLGNLAWISTAPFSLTKADV